MNLRTISLLLATAVALFCTGMNPSGARAAGLRLDFTMREILEAKPPEAATIDTLVVVAPFDQEITVHIGNATVFLTASEPRAADVKLTYALFVTGPLPDQHMDAATVGYDVPLIVDGIQGKGKSSYRLLITPRPVEETPTGGVIPMDTSGWELYPSSYYLFHLAPRSLAKFHFRQFRSILDTEYEMVRDTFNLTAPGKVNFYFVDGPLVDMILDPRFDNAIDPSRGRVAARYDHSYSGVDVQATILMKLHRWWGYAPELLAIGASGFVSPADHLVIQDRREGRTIPLRQLLRTLDFKRQSFPASYHHAASFVRWLIRTYGRVTFHDLYSRSTDLSLERAFWAVYQKTIDDLESEWHRYLDRRTFTATEYYLEAKRAGAYRDFALLYDLLERSVSLADSIPARVYSELGIAAAQLGRWRETRRYFRLASEEAPRDPKTLTLLTEALWANGDTARCEYEVLRLMDLAPTDPRPYVLMGDLQIARRRVDSAASLWETGLRGANPDDPIALEFLLRLGDLAYTRKKPDSARSLFARALPAARRLISSQPDDPRTLARVGEIYMGLDSLDQALSYLQIAAYAAEAPQDLGRIYLAIGRCHDLAGRRHEAVRAYEHVFSIRATHYDRLAARRHINEVYTH